MRRLTLLLLFAALGCIRTLWFYTAGEEGIST